MLPLMPIAPRPAEKYLRGRFLIEHRALLLALANAIKLAVCLPFRLLLRPIRFQLRSLLLLVVLFAAGMAWISYQRSVSAVEMAYAAELEARGNYVMRSGDRHDSELCSCAACDTDWWGELFTNACGERLLSITFKDEVTERDYKVINQLPELVGLCFCNIPNIDVQRLPPVKEIGLKCNEPFRSDQLHHFTKFRVVIFDIEESSTDFITNLRRSFPRTIFLEFRL